MKVLTRDTFSLPNLGFNNKEEERTTGKIKLSLVMGPSKKKGILITPGFKSARVAILHRSYTGDILISHEENVLMIPSSSVVSVSDNEVEEGKKRFAFVKQVYEKFSQGEALDKQAIFLEIHKWLL